MVRTFLLALIAFLPSAAFAGDLDLRLVDQAGKPVADAVVTIKPTVGLPKKPISFPWPSTMVQQNIAFNPHVLVVPVGATVSFPNKDNVRHHIYSFSKPARFDMKLYGQNQAPSYTFRTAGAVALGCNIHDSMNGFIKVVDTPYTAKSAVNGVARVNAIPAGSAVVTIWHPLLRSKDNELTVPVTLPATGVIAKSITLMLRSGM